MWKFQDFSVIKILRETNFGEFGSFKTTVFAFFKALNFVKNCKQTVYEMCRCGSFMIFLSLIISMAESRIVSRETRLRFARQVSRDLGPKSRIGEKHVKIWPKSRF